MEGKDETLEKLRASKRIWAQRNKDYIKKKNKQKLLENPDFYKKYHLKSRYGVSIEEYNSMLIEQEESCEICKKHMSNFKRNLHVDHNHTTKKVRGLLCVNCNIIIGNSFEDKNILANAIEYLNKYED
jgi:hypothetical protein